MIKKIKIEDIKTAHYNPRVQLQAGDPDYEKIKNSIITHGFVEPIVWNERTGVLVGGHQRLQVLKELGYTEVEASIVNLNEKDEKQLNLALNEIRGEWDVAKLQTILKEFDYNEIEETGFTADEVAIIFEDNNDYEYEDFVWDEEIEEAGISYLLALKFANIENAKKWTEENGYTAQVKKGTHTTVIRVGEENGA